ncbi:conserved hypothetical protein [Crenothrix polyspora]|uniref:Uncharacterized protein n=1 Tax=Crenothrix polyspora TaxID=360316 RepID=A0A1R4H5C8_9GAMM|nr:hypothetical protein [Crenothrix polyspora]SJM91465.1 conserved hypothetical protein [Crenothrix polyspora]
MGLDAMSLSQLKEFQGDIPALGNFPERILAETYEEFVSVLYKDIDAIVLNIEENPELRKNDSEDRLTIEIKSSLTHMGYSASHDTKIGGHADLIVKKKSWLWIGEAKIHSSYDYLFQGFQQLTTRYSTGSYNNCEGGMLIYIRKRNIQQIMQKWEEHLKKKDEVTELKISKCPVNPFSFYSTHHHQRTNLPFKVRHIPFNLYFFPEDSK